MTCQEIIDFLMDYLDGGLPPDQRQNFQRHLDDCPECVAYLETYTTTIRVSRVACTAQDDSPCEPIPEALVRAVLSACLKQA